MESGLEYLELTQLVAPDTSCMVEALATALFQISMLPGVKNSHSSLNAIRVVMYLLMDSDPEVVSSVIANAVTSKIKVQVVTLREEVAAEVAEIHEGLAMCYVL